MRKTLLALGLLLAFAPAGAGAISIGLAPSVATGVVGLAFDLDVVVSGLGAGGAPSLGSYDLDIHFDPAQLAFESASFGADLGGPASALQASSEAGGVVDLAEVSLLTPAQLDALQPGSFVLATLRFTPIATGTSSVGFGPGIAGDGSGNALEVSFGGARVVVERAIPEPGALALFALGALALVRGARPRS